MANVDAMFFADSLRLLAKHFGDRATSIEAAEEIRKRLAEVEELYKELPLFKKDVRENDS